MEHSPRLVDTTAGPALARPLSFLVNIEHAAIHALLGEAYICCRNS
jgi:hypothetical protein